MISVSALNQIDISTAFLLALIAFVSLVLILLIAFEGRTNARVKALLKGMKRLQEDMDEKDEKLERLTRLINQRDSELKQQYYQQLGHHLETFNKRRFGPVPYYFMRKTGGLLVQLRRLWRMAERSKYFSEAYLVSYLITLTGTVILGLGLTFYIKFTLSGEVFNVVGKVIVGLISSGMLIAIGHIFHSRNKIFSSILLGGAIALLYYTFALTYYQYELLGNIPTLSIVAVLTAFAIAISLAYKRQELAFIALAAAFTAPFIVDYSPDNYIILFSYILVIDTGVLVLAFFRKWTLLFVITNLFTIVFFAIWLFDAMALEKALPVQGSMIYLTIFYLIFVVIHLAWKVRAMKRFMPIELTFIITNTLLYYSGGYAIINTISDAYNGIFTAFIALVNFFFLFVLHMHRKAHFTLKYAFFALALTFVVLIPPVEFVGRSITLTWAFQIVLLLWIAQQIDVMFMRLGAVLLSLLLGVSLGIDMWNMYVETTTLNDPMPWFLNIGFITNIAAAAGLLANMLLLNREKQVFFIPHIRVNLLRAVFGALALVAFYLSFYLEIRYHLIQQFQAENLIRLYLAIYNTAFLALLVTPALLKRIKAISWAGLALSLIVFVVYFAYYHYLFIDVRNSVLLGNLVSISQYRAHFVVVGLLGFLLYSLHQSVKGITRRDGLRRVSLWFSYAVLVFLISSEADHIMVLRKFQDGYVPSSIAEETHKLIYTVIWTVMASLTALLGIFFAVKNWRHLGYTLFVVVALKLLVYDLPHLDARQQIIAFITVGGSIVITTLFYHIVQPAGVFPDGETAGQQALKE